jgi:hypothetical protein
MLYNQNVGRALTKNHLRATDMKLKPVHWIMLGMAGFIFLILVLFSTLLVYAFFAPTSPR